MTLLTGIYALLIIAITTYILVRLRGATKPGKITSALALTVLSIVFYMTLAQMLGRPRPEFFANLEKAEVISYLITRDGIYLWVLDGSEPLSLSFPFDPKKARELQNQAESAGERGLMLRKKQPEGEWILHPKPHQESPPKSIGQSY